MSSHRLSSDITPSDYVAEEHEFETYRAIADNVSPMSKSDEIRKESTVTVRCDVDQIDDFPNPDMATGRFLI